MGNISVVEIQKKEILSKVQEVRDKGGRLVAINGYVDKDKNNIVVYTLEYDNFRKHYHIKGETILPTVTNIYKGAQWFEEEIQEMMPLKFEGLIFSGRLFLPEEFKEGEGQILIMPLNELKKINGVKDVEVTSNMIKSEILNLELEEDFYDIIGIDESAENDLEDMELYLQDGEIDLEKLKSGEEMILNFSMYADMYDIKVGDILSFELYDGEDIIKKDFKIQAITDGPGVFVIHNNIMDKLVKTNTRHSIGLTIEKNAYNEVKAYVESLVKANENLNGSYIDVEIASSELAIKITKIMGYSLVVLIGVIGFINLINSMITSIITRKKELGMLQAIGLTNKQLVQMLNKEAMFYTSFMLIGSLTIGNIIGYSAVQAMRKSGMSYAVYVLPINQMIIMIVCIVLAQFILTYLISKNFNKESLIDRVRYSE